MQHSLKDGASTNHKAWIYSMNDDSVQPNLAKTPFIFICQGGHANLLLTPYTGPYRMLEHGEKTIKVEFGECSEQVSVDRHKPAKVDCDTPVRLAKPTRRGRPQKNQSSKTVLVDNSTRSL